ncbi:SulP family inorganic anion transporter [Methanococcus maripaludis]|jgi:SulP family sulfate permease|uniref:Sulfate transporter:Sulfate transporter/antisigma-factor antagonist STAS n=3 Tax=Methanococcus maripaludis TaxID=39152 RepID=Q6LZG5_METMP|nr:SulP family inorganic anion transporter [Methanococcus maripaludis]AVB75731.1 Bicarbonate transporter BicA [Methanococcus maripaludis]MBB6497073.1 SulP family sulfate permease [Methanococcus maripaludis]MBM7408650.1 SulP family sulfate permease [Methanococcus maripaludis]MBP2219831.1 SulP family sulfate permease [Methanococcus maripaludis]CAF30219.1 Sulfate transporter:Sulfate transporter/antisigma-factor antagonist STAS [Methanococcus maripaludis S2]
MNEKINTNETKDLKNKIVELVIPKNGSVKNDVLSGLTVALALVPEAIAFSFILGIDPTIGLYAAFIMGIVTALLGGRPGMISGATGSVAVIFAPLVISKVQTSGMESALGYLFIAVLLMGILQVFFGISKVGKFVRLIPHPVMLGFVNGLAIIIFLSQIGQFYGADGNLLPWPILSIMLVLIAITMAISIFLPKITRAVPATLVAIITVTIISYFLNNAGYTVLTVLDFIKSIEPLKTTLAVSMPSFALPNVPLNWDTIKTVLPYSFLAACVGLIESLMTLRLIDELTETRGRSNKECIGQGIANILNGFFGGMGGCAMIGQSMINIRGGGRGRLSGASAAVLLLVFIVWGAPIIEMIPLAALVGVMFIVVIGTFEWSSFRILKKIPLSDAVIIAVVSIMTVVLDLATAVFLGIILAALVFAWDRGKDVWASTKSMKNKKVYMLHGPLFFASTSKFKDLFDYENDPIDVVIDFNKSRVYDHSAIEAINTVAEKYTQHGKQLHLLNLSKDCDKLIKKADNIVEVSILDNLIWHVADDKLE